MDIEQLIGTMITGTLTGGRKRSHGARRFLGGGGQSFLTASTLLTVGGLVWGAIETMQQQQAGTAGPNARPPAPLPPSGSAAPLPPVPGGVAALPPLPGAVAGGVPEAASATVSGLAGIPEGAARIVRLMLSAARADGDLTESERAAVVEHARGVGADALVTAEIAHPTPLARIVDGITDIAQRQDLYVLAYGIVRADETVSGAEQIYLAQLAALLGLDRTAVERLERDAAARIDRAAAER